MLWDLGIGHSLCIEHSSLVYLCNQLHYLFPIIAQVLLTQATPVTPFLIIPCSSPPTPRTHFLLLLFVFLEKSFTSCILYNSLCILLLAYSLSLFPQSIKSTRTAIFAFSSECLECLVHSRYSPSNY